MLLNFKEIIEKVVKHFKEVSDGLFEIKCANFAFTLDSELRIWLIWITAIDTVHQTSDLIRKKEVENYKNLNSLITNFIEPIGFVKPPLVQANRNTLDSFKQRKLCIYCFQSKMIRDMVEIDFDHLIKLMKDQKVNLWYDKNHSAKFECESPRVKKNKEEIIENGMKINDKEGFVMFRNFSSISSQLNQDNKIGREVNFFLLKNYI